MRGMNKGGGRSKAIRGEQRKSVVKLVRLTPMDAQRLAGISKLTGKTEAQWIRDAIRGSLEAFPAIKEHLLLTPRSHPMRRVV